MKTSHLRSSRVAADGFTLIEVIGALVIFSVGVLMVMQLTGTMSLRMETAAVRSELGMMGQERLDSLESVDYDALTVTTKFSITTVRGSTYYWLIMVRDSTAMSRFARVWLLPAAGTGPSFTGGTFVSRSW